MEDMESVFLGLQQELRRGSVVLSVLALLKEPRYGYALTEALESKGMRIEPGTLYPLMRRLEKQGLLQSEWETSGAKPRKYYVQSAQGAKVYERLCAEWADMARAMDGLITGSPKSEAFRGAEWEGNHEK
jgi:DNA-binding PadR family transcriptional regulator